MPEQSLKSYDFRIAYGPSDDRLQGFYIPALSRSIRYDCIAGFFSPFTLAAAVAAGVSYLIRNQGTMRLLAGVTMDEADVTTVRKGHELAEILKDKLLPLLDIKDPLIKRPLEVLAWMTANETLQIRLVLPQKNGRILSVSEARDYDPPWIGIFTDGKGQQIAMHGWLKNDEQSFVFKSWDASAPYLAIVRQRFENLWEGKEARWTTLPLPALVMDRLIQSRPLKSPVQDTLENVSPVKPAIAAGLKEKLFFQFLRDVPQFSGDQALPSPSELEKMLTGSETLKACWERHPAIHDAWYLRWQGKRFEVTFYREIFDRDPELLRFLSYGEPLLQSLLQGITALKNPEACHVPLVGYTVETPSPLVAYYCLHDGEIKPVVTLAELEAVFQARLPEGGTAVALEVRAREHFNTIVRNRLKIQVQKHQAAHRATLRALEEQGKRILVKAAMCDIARARHATLFDQNLIAAGFDEETILRQGGKSPLLASLLSLIDMGRLKPALPDPFWPEVDGKPEKTIKAIEEALQKEAKELLKALMEWKDKTREDIKNPTVSVQLFYKNVQKEKPPLMLVIAPPKKERFTRYLPFYTTTAAAEKFGRLGDAKEEGWMEVELGRKLKKTMFVTQIEGMAMAPLMADGSFVIFDTDVQGSLDGLILLVQGRDVYDPDMGEGITVRRYQGSKRIESQKTFRYQEIRLESVNPDYQSIVLKDVESVDFKVIGRYVSGV